jgi:hypothetical protein
MTIILRQSTVWSRQKRTNNNNNKKEQITTTATIKNP